MLILNLTPTSGVRLSACLSCLGTATPDTCWDPTTVQAVNNGRELAKQICKERFWDLTGLEM